MNPLRRKEKGMNYSAEIVHSVLEEDMHDRDAIRDRVNLSQRVFDALVSKLCGDGTLLSEFGKLRVGNEERARVLAAQSAYRIPRKPGNSPLIVGKTYDPETATRFDRPAEQRPPKTRRPLLELPIPSEFKLENDVPIPTTLKAKRIIPWPFEKMAVGQSFSVPIPEGVTAKDAVAVLRRDIDAFRHRSEDPNWWFILRTEADGKSIRVWRTDVPAKTRAKSTKKPDGEDRLEIPTLGPAVKPKRQYSKGSKNAPRCQVRSRPDE